MNLKTHLFPTKPKDFHGLPKAIPFPRTSRAHQGGIDSRAVNNPAYPQPTPTALASRLAAAGWWLEPRLCVHDGWIGLVNGPLRQAMARARLSLLSPQHC